MIDKAISDEELARIQALGDLPFAQQWGLVLSKLEAASADLDPVRKPDPELYRLYWTAFSCLFELYLSAENWPTVGSAPRYWIPKECAEALQTAISDLGRGKIMPEIGLVRKTRGRPSSGAKHEQAKLVAVVYYELAKRGKIQVRNIALKISSDFGVPPRTIYTWKKEASKNGSVLRNTLEACENNEKFLIYYNKLSTWYKLENLKGQSSTDSK